MADVSGVMEYLPDMEVSDNTLMDKVLNAAALYVPSRYTAGDVHRALEAAECSVEDFAALLSPAAMPFLENMAQKAREMRMRYFGNSVYLFTPLYIANYCENRCLYCGFNAHQKIKRARLSIEEIEKEMQAIAETKLEEILILTGESPAMSNLEYIGEACKMARNYFRVVGVEVYPLDSKDYAYLRHCGADFVTVFQETYDPLRYGELHPGGRKRVFPYRFNAQERALGGGIRGVAFAALLGLRSDFRRDALATGLHAWFLQRKFPQGEISFSCPRLRPLAGNRTMQHDEVGEAELMQIICAYRIFMPFAGITISSRENARFRDNVLGIAATKISAGVDVGIGGHAGSASGDEQFSIDDNRSVKEIREMILKQGLQPVMSDYVYV
ncbi:thiamine biosynthesis protein ThiH [Spirochaetia bacterium]|nr:thiamine biosynthesis protein ThiH [Spirochaetia bacterium]